MDRIYTVKKVPFLTAIKNGKFCVGLLNTGSTGNADVRCEKNVTRSSCFGLTGLRQLKY